MPCMIAGKSWPVACIGLIIKELQGSLHVAENFRDDAKLEC